MTPHTFTRLHLHTWVMGQIREKQGTDNKKKKEKDSSAADDVLKATADCNLILVNISMLTNGTYVPHLYVFMGVGTRRDGSRKNVKCGELLFVSQYRVTGG